MPKKLNLDALKKAQSASKKGAGSAKKGHRNFWLLNEHLEKNAPLLDEIAYPTDVEFCEMTDEEYRCYPAISNSDLTMVGKRRTGLEMGFSKSTKEAFKTGSAFHYYFLEFEKYEAAFAELSEDAQKEVKLMTSACKAEKEFATLAHHPCTQKEIVALWTEPITGAQCKAKIDVLNWDGRITLDLKSTSKKTKRGFLSSAKSFGYDRQAAWYLLPTQTESFKFLAASKANGKAFWISYKKDSPEILKAYSHCIYLLKLAVQWQWMEYKNQRP